MMLLHAQRVLEVLPHAILVVVELVWVGDSHLGRLVLIELVLDRLSDQLLRGHLDLSWRIILYTRHFHHATLLLDHSCSNFK